MTIFDPVFALISALVLCAVMATHPTQATCPEGWYVEGVRPSGRYYCRPRSKLPDHASRGREQNDPPDPATDHEIHGDLYCTGGKIPIVESANIVGCQPR
jgi:hypothetical protein